MTAMSPASATPGRELTQLGRHEARRPSGRCHRRPGEHGAWTVGADGGVFTAGNNAFYGSLGDNPPSSRTPVVAMATTPDGAGYWLTTSDTELPAPPTVTAVVDQCEAPSALAPRVPTGEHRPMLHADGAGSGGAYRPHFEDPTAWNSAVRRFLDTLDG